MPTKPSIRAGPTNSGPTIPYQPATRPPQALLVSQTAKQTSTAPDKTTAHAKRETK